MSDQNYKLDSFRYFDRAEIHKGFYNTDDITKALCSIRFEDYLEEPEDDEFPYYSAHQLLCGSCHIFALSLQKLLGYNTYVIRGINGKSFHAFCQLHKDGRWFYVDARGVTSSFNEFMDVAKTFVKDEYTINPIVQADIDDWKQDDKFYDKAAAFAEAIIEKYKSYYKAD